MLQHNEYELLLLQETAVGGYNGSRGYNVGGYYCNSGFNVSSYTIIACSVLHKQLCWEFG